MRILFLSTIIMFLYSCNNDLDSVGQDLMDNGNFVEMKEYNITDVSTVKLDSFLTSSGYMPSNYALTELLMGKYSDSYSGTTTAIPCFPIVPTSIPSVGETYVLDSVTLNFTYGGRIWGDTLNGKIQKFHLYRLDKMPEINKDEEYLLYNTTPLPPYTEKLSELSFLPFTDNIQKSYFKFNTEAGIAWGKKLFEAMVYKGKIYDDLPWSFLNEFKGLAIVPAEDNNCILNIRAVADSLYLRFHFHKTEDKSTYDIPFGQKEYMYNSILTENAQKFQDLTQQQASVPFSTAGISLIQGLSGYMTRMILPKLPTPQQYSTIVKAELEMKPEIFVNPQIAMPTTINAYKTNNKNEVLTPLYNNQASGIRVTGTYVVDPISKQNSKYIFDVTDYYQQIISGNQDNISEREILLRIPDWTTSFNRAVIVETPILRVYYAHYNN